jgi:hypothetical protein
MWTPGSRVNIRLKNSSTILRCVVIEDTSVTIKVNMTVSRSPKMMCKLCHPVLMTIDHADIESISWV